MNKITPVFIILLFLLGGYFLYNSSIQKPSSVSPETNMENNSEGGGLDTAHPLSIQSLREGQYPGSDLVIEQTLEPGSNYQRYIASYKSEGLKIYALLTIPNGTPPESGWPAIIFNHGYIPPQEYRTTERYIAYTDAFSSAGYILLRPDYRGHGESEGQAAGGYGSNAYTIDVLNAVSSLKNYNNQLSSGRKIVDVSRIGMWGHSMGGHITLRNMVVSKDVKAGVIWAGVVASYPDLLNNWRRRSSGPSMSPLPSGIGNRGWRQSLVEQYGEPEKNPQFWNSISANSYLKDISGPVQIHHGTADTSVPVAFSQKLEEQLKAVGKESELFIYEGDDHNLASNLGIALKRSVEFFDKYLK